MDKAGPIGVFDSGYGGLTILTEFQTILPQYDYYYLGDNARAPYGTRSFEVVYEFTRQAVFALFEKGCNLVILACNTASAKALRTIQQNDLPEYFPSKRVLGIIRPTAEVVGTITKNGHLGILGTSGTIQSNSYVMEINKFFPKITITSEACPMWVPLVENNEAEKDGADYFVKQHLDILFSKDPLIDTLILGCTHYPLLISKIKKFILPYVKLIAQGEYIADSLKDYLNRHPEIDNVCSKNGITTYFTTESPTKFSETASLFLNKQIKVERIELE